MLIKPHIFKNACERQKLLLTAIFAILFSVAAHAYCWLNSMYSHDSLLIVQTSDNAHQMSLGRFLQPVYYGFIRGDIVAPWLVGLLSTAFLTLAAYLLILALRIDSKKGIALVCGFFAANLTVTLSNATYIGFSDMFALACLMNVAAAFLLDRYKYGFLAGAAFLVIGLALYQSYFSVAVGLAMILAIKRILEKMPVKCVLLFCLKAMGMLLLGLIIYAVITVLSGIQLSNGYNGLSGVGDFSGVSLLSLLKEAYRYIIMYFFKPVAHNALVTLAANIILFAAALFLIVRRLIAGKAGAPSVILLAVLCALLPLGLNIIYVISKGIVHQLMIFSFNLAYIMAVMLMETNSKEMPESRGKKLVPAVRIVGTVAAVLILFNNIVYSNDVYIRKELEYQATLSTITRVIDRMEQTRGYIPGETPVIFLGNLLDSVVSDSRGEAFDELRATGIWYNFSVTYEQTLKHYFEYVLGYPLRFTDEETKSGYAALDEVKRLPAFPSAGFCKMINGNLVVKLADIN